MKISQKSAEKSRNQNLDLRVANALHSIKTSDGQLEKFESLKNYKAWKKHYYLWTFVWWLNYWDQYSRLQKVVQIPG